MKVYMSKDMLLSAPWPQNLTGSYLFFFNLENEEPKNKIMFMKSSGRHAVLGEQLMV
jgi:hypothetical protein